MSMTAELQAAKALLDEGIKVPVTAPLFFKMFGKQKLNLVVKQPYLGTLYRISKIYLASGLAEDQETKDAELLFLNHGKAMSRIAAMAILNGYWKGKFLGGLLSWWLFENMPALYLQTIMQVLKVVSGREAFTNTIKLVGEMIMTTPNLSQQTQGS